MARAHVFPEDVLPAARPPRARPVPAALRRLPAGPCPAALPYGPPRSPHRPPCAGRTPGSSPANGGRDARRAV